MYRRESRILLKFKEKKRVARRSGQKRERERERDEGEPDSGWGIDFLSSSSTTFRPSGGVPTLSLKSSQETRERKSKESTISHISYRGGGPGHGFSCASAKLRVSVTQRRRANLFPREKESFVSVTRNKGEESRCFQSESPSVFYFDRVMGFSREHRDRSPKYSSRKIILIILDVTIGSVGETCGW